MNRERFYILRYMSFHPKSENYKYWTLSEENELKSLIKSSQFSFKQIGKRLGRSGQSCQDHSRLMGLKSNYLRRKYSHDEHFWSTPNLLNSYWAGFAAADACVKLRKDKSTFILEIDKNDLTHLEKFVADTQFTGKINDISLTGRSNTVKVEIHGEWHKKLEENFGVVTKKTYRLQPPRLPDDLAWAYIIGYIDGDGTIHFNKCTGQLQIQITSSSPIILEWILNRVLSLNLITQRNKIINVKKLSHANCHFLSISGIRAWQLFDFLRKFDCPKLDRKWKNPNVLSLLYSRLPIKGVSSSER